MNEMYGWMDGRMDAMDGKEGRMHGDAMVRL